MVYNYQCKMLSKSMKKKMNIFTEVMQGYMFFSFIIFSAVRMLKNSFFVVLDLTKIIIIFVKHNIFQISQ